MFKGKTAMITPRWEKKKTTAKRDLAQNGGK